MEETADLIVLPLSPEAAMPLAREFAADQQGFTFEPHSKQSLWRPLDGSKRPKEEEEIGGKSTIFVMDLPDRRRKKRGRKEADKVLSLESMGELQRKKEAKVSRESSPPKTVSSASAIG